MFSLRSTVPLAGPHHFAAAIQDHFAGADVKNEAHTLVRMATGRFVRERIRTAAFFRFHCCRFSCRLTPKLSGIASDEQRQITLSVND
jgi:hypothetical protein